MKLLKKDDPNFKLKLIVAIEGLILVILFLAIIIAAVQ